MRFLHTSDWHVGRVLRGRPRLDEQAAVLAELVAHARDQAADAVLVCGDVYDSSTPSAQAQRLVVQTLLALRGTGAQVVVLAGNHDHAATFDAYRPLMDVAGITVVGTPRRADRGGVVTFRAASTGEQVRVAVLPFLSQRFAVRAVDLVQGTPAEHGARYDELVRGVIGSLTAGFAPDAVNVVMAHLTVTGAVTGAGGERPAHTIFEYHVPAVAFPADAHYVALGHLHRRQQVPAACPVHYCGAPYAVDFGEQDNTHVTLLVEATPTTPARVTELPMRAGRRLRTVAGTVEELAEAAAGFGDDYLRVDVTEPYRAGLTDEVRQVLPNALVVRIDPRFADPVHRPAAGRSAARTPAELFADFCAERGIADPRLERLFATLSESLHEDDPEDDPDDPAPVRDRART